MEPPKKKRGRPPGTYKGGAAEGKDHKLTLRITQTAHEWVKQHPEGWITQLVEDLASGKKSIIETET